MISGGEPSGTVIIREATPEDATLLIDVVDMASEGLLPVIWSAMAPEGMDGKDMGLVMVTAPDGEFSYRHAFVVEQNGQKCGAMIGFPLPEEPEPIEPDMPEAFAAIKALEQHVPGYWYINFIAVYADCRGQNLGTALLEKAEALAHTQTCPALALIVAASNPDAAALYERLGFREKVRVPFDLTEFGAEKTEALLMVKGF